MSEHHDLSGYLLGELSDDERARFEQAIANDPTLRARVERLRPVVEQLGRVPGSAWETVVPAGEKQPPARPRLRGRSTVRLPRLAALLAATVLVGAGIAIGVLIERPSSPHGVTVSLRPLQGAPSTASGVATTVGAARIVLRVRRLRPTAPGAYYEAWLMTSTTDLVPIASFDVNNYGNADLDVPLPAPPHQYRYIDISLQHLGAGLAHSQQSVLRGPTP
jgi:Anti-sigma-K factor rskA